MGFHSSHSITAFKAGLSSKIAKYTLKRTKTGQCLITMAWKPLESAQAQRIAMPNRRCAWGSIRRTPSPPSERVYRSKIAKNALKCTKKVHSLITIGWKPLQLAQEQRIAAQNRHCAWSFIRRTPSWPSERVFCRKWTKHIKNH